MAPTNRTPTKQPPVKRETPPRKAGIVAMGKCAESAMLSEGQSEVGHMTIRREIIVGMAKQIVGMQKEIDELRAVVRSQK